MAGNESGLTAIPCNILPHTTKHCEHSTPTRRWSLWIRFLAGKSCYFAAPCIVSAMLVGHTHTHTYTRIHTQTQAHSYCVCMYIRFFEVLHTHTRAHTHTPAHVRASNRPHCVHTHTHTKTHMQKHTRIYISISISVPLHLQIDTARLWLVGSIKI